MKKFSLGKVGTAITNKLGRTGLRLKKASPDILVGLGIVGVTGATIMACKASTQLGDIVDEFKETRDSLVQAKEESEAVLEEATEEASEAVEKAYRTSVVKLYTGTAIRIARLYGPSVALYGASVLCIVKSHGILKQRNLGLAAAYELLDRKFKEYRHEVVDRYGEEIDQDCMYNRVIEHDVAEDGMGEKAVTVYHIPPEGSIYGFWWDNTCANFEKDPTYIMAYMNGTQSQLDYILNARGHVILHEVYDAFSKDHTPESIVTGWVKGNGDDCIDLGFSDGVITRDEFGRVIKIDPDNPEERQLMRNGVWIEPNVDGVIYNKL